jgi:hypothetical protein
VVTGTIFDSETKKPIDGVLVFNKTKPTKKSQNDNDGSFEVTSISGGISGCPPMTIIVEHSNYESQEITIPAGGSKEIFLKRIKEKTCMEKIDLILHDYTSVGESVDSENNKKTITDCLKELESNELTDQNFNRLIELWMYYDPTDFPTRDLVFELFKTRKSESINAINKRIDEKESWEDEDNAPFSELKYLIEKLENE